MKPCFICKIQDRMPKTSYCGPCKKTRDRQIYLRSRSKRIAQSTILVRKNRQERYDAIRPLKEVPCADCGQRYPHYVMDFDHVSGKKVADVSVLCYQRAPLEVIQSEVQKCQVVCSNCHRIRTWTRKEKS